jgi:hypothetical protein
MASVHVPVGLGTVDRGTHRQRSLAFIHGRLGRLCHHIYPRLRARRSYAANLRMPNAPAAGGHR